MREAQRARILNGSYRELMDNEWHRAGVIDLTAARERRYAAEHLASLSPERRAELERQWHSPEDI